MGRGLIPEPGGIEPQDELEESLLRLHKQSHLSSSPAEGALTDFEFALHHVAEAFRRWATALNAYVSGEELSAQDVSVLQVVRFHERPKSVSEIAKFLNREDAANVQYSLRKLERTGLIAKVPGTSQRRTVYEVTARGRAVTDHYARLRREILVKLAEGIGSPQGLVGEATEKLLVMTGLYDQAARRVAINRSSVASVDSPRFQAKGREGNV